MNGVDVNVTRYNEYVRIKIRKNLVLTYCRVELPTRIRHNIIPIAPGTIYKTMILPILLYCNKIVIAATRTQNKDRKYSISCHQSH